MRFAALLFLLLSVFPTSIGSQSEEADPYSIQFVQSSLQIVSQNPGVTTSFVQKNLARLGDAVSIALLKILDDKDLTNPKTVEAFLPLIRESFSFPPIISMEVNKKPKVTMFVLKYLQQNVSAAQARQDIQQTIDFVKEKTTERGEADARPKLSL